jgi:hypothetical protein
VLTVICFGYYMQVKHLLTFFIYRCRRDLKLENLLLHTERDEPDETSMSTIPVSADAMDDASSGGRKRKLAGDSRPRVLITDFGQSENVRRFLREPRTGTARCWCRDLIASPAAFDVESIVVLISFGFRRLQEILEL